MGLCVKVLPLIPLSLNFIKPIILDINECNDNPCSINATCFNTPGSFSCSCNSGFAGNGFLCSGTFSLSSLSLPYYQSFFTDINECAAQTDNCTANSSCVNTVGSYICPCLPGYATNGSACIGTTFN
jgi:hypothetical protein